MSFIFLFVHQLFYGRDKYLFCFGTARSHRLECFDNIRDRAVEAQGCGFPKCVFTRFKNEFPRHYWFLRLLQKMLPYCNEVPPTGFGVAIGSRPNANQRRVVARAVVDHTLFLRMFGV
jgi:hypothetical protein